MKRTMTFTASMLLWILSAVVLSACGDSGTSGSTLSGTLTKSGVPDGTRAYLKLVARGQSSTAPALYFTSSAPFALGKATYSVSGVKDGSYTGWAFIDMNGNAAGDATSMPDTGDYATAHGGEITVQGDTVADIPEVAWIEL